MFLEMKVSGIALDPFTNTPIVILKDLTGEKVLPIWIGFMEASAIAMELEKTPRARPLTHDLMKTLLETLKFRSDLTGEKVLPIWIGFMEASAIAMELEKTPRARPLTHDLMKTLLETLKFSVIRVDVTDLK